ncbi:MAG: hypothetical protein U5K76_08495 [Woeseiaceae bacterium]|nr:hypothetical protein [Woeseiaceae bacterium]
MSNVMETRLEARETAHTAPARNWMRPVLLLVRNRAPSLSERLGISLITFLEDRPAEQYRPEVHRSWLVLFGLDAGALHTGKPQYRARNIALHRKLRLAGFLAASQDKHSATACVLWSVWEPWHRMSFLVQANQVAAAGVFGACYFLPSSIESAPTGIGDMFSWRRFTCWSRLYQGRLIPSSHYLTRFSDKSDCNAAWWVLFVAHMERALPFASLRTTGLLLGRFIQRRREDPFVLRHLGGGCLLL